MEHTDNDIPECFGKLDVVFPQTESGLRQSPDKCMLECPHKTECLRSALYHDQKSDELHHEKVDQEYDSGLITFFERWSRKKTVSQRSKKRSKSASE